ncbi:uncharacterized protein Z519_05158 [Cladophialophora bantiana CBS 173.52]|uniref:C2H2-type domain-containing protein n=1 Tax=Cladophialophora bantiana (strain ATCC 10958 / CBS 173.52 / CDC B-1940 / NIH 8579) TaxID=1442370 RepID=A0A0D2HKM8_CLAB1|nr:uncharacterized protein Z519_05158 [Cladophialophora bantiana CBS 173.52]KIW93843.1 hypothetical protein Z519_05158 [Cladophialophora bantiana CBS 173.52]
MSGAEIGIAVIGAVAALITAYKDAGAIVENIKERRKAKGALPPSVALEESLQEGHQEIEKITAKGIQRFGPTFEQGDDIAHRALQSLTIEVQASFLHHLMLASKDDSVIDFEACIDSAIEARLRAVTILNELYLRQQKPSSPVSEPTYGLSVNPNLPVKISRPFAEETKEVSEASAPTERKKRSSLTSGPVPQTPRNPQLPAARISRSSPDEMKEVIEGPAPTERKERSGTLGSETPPAPGDVPRKPSWNVFKILHRTSSAEKENISTPPQATSRPPSYVTSPTSPSIRSLDDPRRSQVMTPPISPVSTVSSIDVLAAAGFCKGAYYVQQGIYEKGVQVSMKNMEWACHCRKCPFATPADRDERGRARFDDKVHSTRNLRWRSLVLFKSHISSSQKKSRLYRCLLCVLLGDSSSVFQGEQHLFEHMFHHQGGIVNGVELWGPICLDPGGARMGSERTFDICFAENPRFALPEGAFEMGVATEIVEADGTEIYDEDVFKNQWVDEGQR